MQSRRAFLGSTAALGLGSLAAGGSLLLQPRTGSAQDHGGHAARRLDPVFNLFIAEAAAIRREMKRSGVRGEHARRLSIALKMLGTYGTRMDLDARVRAATRQLIARQGREALLHASLDHQHMIAELRAHGAVDAEELPDPNLLTRDQRIAGLDEILTRGVTPLLFREAAMFDREAPALDRFSSLRQPLVAAALRQESIEREQCMLAWQTQILIKQAMALMFCVNPITWEICLALQFNVLLMQAASLYACSDN